MKALFSAVIAVIVGGVAGSFAGEVLLGLLSIYKISVFVTFGALIAMLLGACWGGIVAATIAPLDAWLCGALSAWGPIVFAVVGLVLYLNETAANQTRSVFDYTSTSLIAIIVLSPIFGTFAAVIFTSFRKKREASKLL